MRQLLFLPLLMLLLFSCGQNKMDSSDDLSSMTFSIDTVVVDAGQEIINLKYGLWKGIFSPDYSTLYLWDDDDVSMAKISINDLRLAEKIKFEKEGPDGVGSYITWTSMLYNGNFLVANFTDFGLFDQSGKKLRSYDLSKENLLDEEKKGQTLYQKSLMTDDGSIVYGRLGGWMDDDLNFVKIDFKEKTVQKLKLLGYEELPNYKIVLSSDMMTRISPSVQTISHFGKKLIISGSAYNTLFSIDLETDSIQRIDYNPQLSAKGKTGKFPQEVDSEKQFKEVMNEIQKEINFQPPFWDDENKRFYRFSYQTTPTEISNTPLIEETEEKSISKVFLTVFDENFQVLGESVVPQLNQPPSSPFVKDGKIWMYVNVDDELGFARLTIK
jgi:hypothetical protein